MRLALRVFAISVLTIGSVVGLAGAPAASATTTPLCEEVWTGGDWLLPESFGRCLDWGGGTFCQEQYANADPEIKLEFYVCAPAPVSTP